MCVPARQQRRVLPDERFQRLAAELGEEHVVVGVRRAVEEDERCAVELAADDRREGAHLLDVRGVQLRQRPLAYLELAFSDRLRRVRGNLEQERVRVAEHRRAAEGRQTVECLPGLRPALHDVAEADDLFHAEPLDVLDRSAEGDVVPMLVGDESEAHGHSLALMPARPLRTHSGWSVKSP